MTVFIACKIKMQKLESLRQDIYYNPRKSNIRFIEYENDYNYDEETIDDDDDDLFCLRFNTKSFSDVVKRFGLESNSNRMKYSKIMNANEGIAGGTCSENGKTYQDLEVKAVRAHAYKGINLKNGVMEEFRIDNNDKATKKEKYFLLEKLLFATEKLALKARDENERFDSELVEEFKHAKKEENTLLKDLFLESERFAKAEKSREEIIAKEKFVSEFDVELQRVQQKEMQAHQVKKRIRPITKQRLHHFLFTLLEDETRRDCIRWVDRNNGIFQIKDKERVTELWGYLRNRKMTYDSFSRGLRHYYRIGLLKPVSKKLHYQLTEKALKKWDLNGT